MSLPWCYFRTLQSKSSRKWTSQRYTSGFRTKSWLRGKNESYLRCVSGTFHWNLRKECVELRWGCDELPGRWCGTTVDLRKHRSILFFSPNCAVHVLSCTPRECVNERTHRHRRLNRLLDGQNQRCPVSFVGKQSCKIYQNKDVKNCIFVDIRSYEWISTSSSVSVDTTCTILDWLIPTRCYWK